MNKLQQLIKEYLYEQLYECECILKSDTAKNFTKVTDNLRGVCGITVVTVIVPAQSERGRTVETSRVRVFVTAHKNYDIGDVSDIKDPEKTLSERFESKFRTFLDL